MVCIVLYGFLLTVLQESSNLDTIFIVCRKIKNKISKMVFSLTPLPLFGQKPTFLFFFNTSLREGSLKNPHIQAAVPSRPNPPQHTHTPPPPPTPHSNKKVINPTINSYLENQWFKNWENIKGHSQTKFWFSMPDPYLSSKLLNMSREYLGKCIQFFTGHGWWKKHLKLTKLSNNKVCRLCQLPDSIESPIHIFSECVAMTATRQGLFNYPFPSQQLGKNQLCQVAELALIDIVLDLTIITPMLIHRSEHCYGRNDGGNGLLITCPCCSCSSNSLLTPGISNVENKPPTQGHP